MPFGIRSAQEVFQKRISQLFEGLEGVETDIDDILVWGRSRQEHDDRLRTVLNKCQEVGLTRNAEKCKIKMKEITYIGHTLSAEGVRPDQEKIKAITEIPAPVDKKGVQRQLGTVNYLAKFVPNMSAVTDPIRKRKEENEFVWTHEQNAAFEKIKNILTNDPVLRFFDVSNPITVRCDASNSGLGAVLLQEGKPIAFASRSLTDAETRYANIERELLTVLFGLERFHQYTYGRDVTVQSDHKPLEAIVRKSLGNFPPRLQRMLLRLQKYNFTLEYRPGKDLTVPDMLSRASLITNKEENSVGDDFECFVNLVIQNKPVSDSKLEQIKHESKHDVVMRKLKDVIRDGWSEVKYDLPQNVREYWNFRNELSEADGIILKGENIVISTTMRKQMLMKLHESHLGIEKTKKLAREYIFWPGMNAQIAETVSKCGTCLANRNSNRKGPMKMSEIPDLPWNAVGTDLFQFDNHNYVIVVDYYSRYFEIARLENTKASCVISHIKSIFR